MEESQPQQVCCQEGATGCWCPTAYTRMHTHTHTHMYTHTRILPAAWQPEAESGGAKPEGEPKPHEAHVWVHCGYGPWEAWECSGKGSLCPCPSIRPWGLWER